MVKPVLREGRQCPSYIEIGEELTRIDCQRNEGHRGKHREFLESTDEHTNKHVSVIVEWLEQD